MLLFDLPLEELRAYALPQERQPDFAAFWTKVLERSRNQPLESASDPFDYPVPGVRVERVSFAAYDGGRIVGWSVTQEPVSPRPTLVYFHGYSGHKHKICECLMWALQGFTVLTFDVRGQLGESTDLAMYPGGRYSGWMTSGILEPEKYYFVRAYADTVRALDFAEVRPEVDASRMGVAGTSQGGGLALAAASLDQRPDLCMAEVPGFCHFRRTLQMTRQPPWTDLMGQGTTRRRGA